MTLIGLLTLKEILLNTSNTFKNERELIKETENLYDLKLLSSNMRIGNYSNMSFKIRFLNEKYTEEPSAATDASKSSAIIDILNALCCIIFVIEIFFSTSNPYFC